MATDNIVMQFVTTTPPITRVLVALTVVVSVSTFLNFVRPQQLSYSRFYLWEWQPYRIFTTFFYYGKANFELIMNFIFLYKYSSMLEESYGKKSDYFFVLLIVFIILFATSNVIYIPFLATALSNTITYIWSRKNPQGIVQIFGFVSFNAFYLPFIFPMVSLIFEGRVSKDEILGIVVGQIVFYLKDVYPKFGRDWLKTPCWCHKLFNERGPCCEPKKTGPVMRKKVSDFARTKQEATLSENSDRRSLGNGEGNHDAELETPLHEGNKPEDQGAMENGQCPDEFDSYSIDEEERLDTNTASESHGEDGNKDDECKNASHKAQRLQDCDLENPMHQAISSDSSAQQLGNDFFEMEDEIDQGDEESFNSEEICGNFEDRSGDESAKEHKVEQESGTSEGSKGNSLSHDKNSWDSE